MDGPWRLFSAEGASYYPRISPVENFVCLEITEPDHGNLEIYFSHNTISRGNSAGYRKHEQKGLAVHDDSEK